MIPGSSKQRALITIAVSLAAILASGAGTWFLYRETRTIKKESEMIRAEVAALEAENSAMRDFQAIRQERADEISRIDAFFIERDRPLGFIEALESLGRATKTRLAIDTEGTNKTSGYFTFRLSADGSTENTLAFLTLLEEMPYKILIRAFNADVSEGTAGSDASGRTRLTLTIDVKTE